MTMVSQVFSRVIVPALATLAITYAKELGKELARKTAGK